MRSNYQVGVDLQPERSAAEKQSLAARAVFDLAEQAIRGIEEGTQVEAALRELWASLIECRHLRARTLVSERLRRYLPKLPPSLRCTSAPELL